MTEKFVLSYIEPIVALEAFTIKLYNTRATGSQCII